MNFKQIGNSRDELLVTVQNSDITTVSAGIGPGLPLVLHYPGIQAVGQRSQANGLVENGLGVVLPANAPGGNAQAQTCFYGVNTAQMGYLQQGAAMVDGYYPSAVVRLATRAATTDSWSATTLANWAMLTVDTVNNCFGVSATTAVGSAQAVAVLLGAISVTGVASNATVTTNSNTFAASASSTADTRTVITTSARIQVRCL